MIGWHVDVLATEFTKHERAEQPNRNDVELVAKIPILLRLRIVGKVAVPHMPYALAVTVHQWRHVVLLHCWLTAAVSGRRASNASPRSAEARSYGPHRLAPGKTPAAPRYPFSSFFSSLRN